ncbi:hypothetical protein FB45DRAFT_901298, partial [Roridomyces roridus]
MPTALTPNRPRPGPSAPSIRRSFIDTGPPSTMNCQFSFGPHRSYFISADSAYAWSENNLPQSLMRLLQDPNLEIPHDVAFPMEAGLYASCWRTTSGHNWSEDGCLGPHYVRLARFIKSVTTSGGHTTRTVFGPGASYFSMSGSGYSWQNIPFALEEGIHNSMKIRKPTSVALGIQGSYVVLFNDGTVTFDLRGFYPLVEGMIRNTQEAARRRGIMYIALNPFVAGEYYAVFGDGSASWNFPTVWGANVTAVSQKIRPVETPATAATADSSPGGTASPVVQPMPVASGGTSSGSPSILPRPPSVASIVSNIAGLPSTASSIVSHQEPAPFRPTSVVSSASGGAEVIPPSHASVIVSNVAHSTGGTISAVNSPIPTMPMPITSPSNSPAMIGPSIIPYQTEPLPPPAYADDTTGYHAHSASFSTPHSPASPPPRPPSAFSSPTTTPTSPKLGWKQGMSMGLKAAQGLNKIINAIPSNNQTFVVTNPGSDGDTTAAMLNMGAALLNQVGNNAGSNSVQQQQNYYQEDTTASMLNLGSALLSQVNSGSQDQNQEVVTMSTMTDVFDMGGVQGALQETQTVMYDTNGGTAVDVTTTTTYV